MRIVLDTNVLVSGLLNAAGNPGRVIDGIMMGDIVTIIDDRIVGEYREVLGRPKFAFDAQQRSRVLDFLLLTAERVSAPPLSVALPDPGDRPFLEVAIHGRANALVTGNVRHFPPESRGDAVVLTPTEFVVVWANTRARQGG